MTVIERAFISERASITIVDFLADELPLSKSKIKDAMQKGAVWLKRGDDEPERVRRAKETVKLRDEIHIYYDSEFLTFRTPELTCIENCGSYSIWYRPETILNEVSLFGDHLNLERAIDISVPGELDCHWVYPNSEGLDGLIIFAHSRQTAAKFEQLELEDGIETDYVIERSVQEGLINSYDEFLTEHESLGLRQQQGEYCRYYFVQAQGKELDLLENFCARIETRRLKEYPLVMTCYQLQFTCPITAELRVFSSVLKP